MSVRLEDHTIILEGKCGVEQVEALLALLEAHPQRPVDIGAATTVHTALWQVMLMIRPRIVGTPPGDFVKTHVLPIVRQNFRGQKPDGDGGELANDAT